MGRRQGTGFARIVRLGVTVTTCFVLANCSSKLAGKFDPRYGVSSSPRVIADGEPVPKGGGTYRVGKPYVVAGRTYVPEEDTHYRAEGLASWYGDDFHGRLTANGEVFDMHALSAAHPTLPMPCYVRVTNLANGRSLIVRVNDRGPYAHNRLIDLSVKAAKLLQFHSNGLAHVRVEYVGRAPLEGSDDRMLLATLRQGEPAPAPSRVMVASAQPFIPEYSDPTPMARHRAVPVPQERPFDLGDERDAAPFGRPTTTATTAARLPSRAVVHAVVREAAALPPKPESDTTFNGRWQQGPAGIPVGPQSTHSPVTAYAPSQSPVPAAFESGRGLY